MRGARSSAASIPAGVIDDRTIDPSIGDPGLGRGEIGEPTAAAEAERAHFAGAFVVAAQPRCGGGDFPDVDLLDFRLGTQHYIAFSGVEIGNFLRIPIGLREKDETRPAPGFGQREAAWHRRHFAFGCHSPSAAPVGSVMIENEPAFGTSMTSRMTVAPSDLALAVAAATSSTRT